MARFLNKIVDMKLAFDLFKRSNEIIQREGTLLCKKWDYLPQKIRKQRMDFLETLDKLNTICELHILFSNSKEVKYDSKTN